MKKVKPEIEGVVKLKYTIFEDILYNENEEEQEGFQIMFELGGTEFFYINKIFDSAQEAQNYLKKCLKKRLEFEYKGRIKYNGKISRQELLDLEE